jgi:hypothetical protein
VIPLPVGDSPTAALTEADSLPAGRARVTAEVPSGTVIVVAGSLVALAAVVRTPGVSRFFGCTPLDPLSWLVVRGWAAAATVGAEVVPRSATG